MTSTAQLTVTEQKVLFSRIQRAKYLLIQRINYLKSKNAGVFQISELNYNLDVLHEAERVGVRNLSELQQLRVMRVIAEVEGEFITPN